LRLYLLVGCGHATPALAVRMEKGHEDVLRAFENSDLNGDGILSHMEFSVLMRLLSKEFGIPLPPQEALLKLYDAADANRNGAVDYTEFIDWLFSDDCEHKDKIFPSPTKSEKSETDIAPPVDPLSDDEVEGDSSSESSADDEQRADAEAKSRHRRPSQAPVLCDKDRRCVVRSLKHEEPVTTMEEMYELLTTVRGKITGLLRLQALVNNFARCKKGKMGPLLARLIPQEVGENDLAEDVSPMELGHLYALVREKPEATAEDAAMVIASVKDVCRSMEKHNVEDLGLQQEDPVGFGDFQRLVGFLSATMKIDQSQILATMAWAKTDRFELTECMAIAVMDNMFLAHDKPGQHILETPITTNAFLRMCYASGLVDNNSRKGMPRAHLEIMFTDMVKHLPKRRLDREKRRKEHLGKMPRRRKHSHKSIRGRTELAILIEELYRNIPRVHRQYSSPLHLCLRLMEGSKEGGKRKRLR